MSGQPTDPDPVTVCTDATENGTIVRVVAPSRHIRMVDLMPVFEALDLNLVSYTAERDPDAGPAAGMQLHLSRRKHSFRGRFLVTDADGQNLSDELLDGLVGALQDALHVRLSRSGRCGPLQDDSQRRDSYASYEGSMDPESPSCAAAALHAAHLAAAAHGSGGQAHSHLHPHPGGHGLSHLHPHHAQHTQHAQQLHNHHHHNHNHTNHEHTASAGSTLLSDQSMSSISSLIRAASGAPSDQAPGPCLPGGPQHEPSFLHQLHEHVLLEGPSHVAEVDAHGGAHLHHEERFSGAATTPFAAGTYHHQHTRSQPVSSSVSQAPDLFDMAITLPQRASSTSTPLGDPSSGRGHGPGEDGEQGVGLGSGRSRTAHVTFSEPPQSTSASASGATGTTTPFSSRPPSAPVQFVSAPNGFFGPLAGVAGCGAGRAGSGAAALEGLASTLAVATGAAAAASSGGSRGDASPTSSEARDGDGDGCYTWWSTVSAHDSVARIMSSPARSISADADLGQAKSMMQRYNISALLVDTGGPAPGFITKRDFLKVQFSKNFKRTKVKDVMTQPVIYVDIRLPIEQCSRVLEASGVRRVLVHDPALSTDDNPLSGFVGVVSDADLFKCMGAPAMSPVVGSVANSADCGPASSLAGGPAALHKLPTLSSLASSSLLLPGTSTGSISLNLNNAPSADQQQPRHSQQQGQAHTLPPPPQQLLLHQQQQPAGLQALSSVASTASAGQSAGPSHAPSISGTEAGAALAMAASSGSVIRLNAEASLADRYRCAAALWELDFNELEVTRRIGEGSFGEVLLANFRGTKVAVKRLRGFDLGPDNPDGGPGEPGPSPTQMPIFRQFFEREIEILATIRHPNVVNFIGACHTPPNVCLVTEYCARGSLDHLLHKTNIHVDTIKKVEFSMDIARGMSCLHSQKPPIIHRDLKTANLLVSARFEVKVADFGLSRIKDHAQLINSRAGLEGTVEYAAPEVLRGEPYTEKCDIWSYAVLLWEIIHRQRPYADADVPVYILMMSLGNGTLRLPPVREELATPGLARLVDRCMAWHPAERPSFREVLHVLEAEYKILRGKAAAVPRSDSASSMVVLPGVPSALAADHPHPQHPPVAAGSKDPHAGQHSNAGPGRPAAAAAPPRPLASPPGPHTGAGAGAGAAGGTPFADSQCGRNAADAAACGAHAPQPQPHHPHHAHSHAHHPHPHHPHPAPQPGRPRVRLAEPHHAAAPSHTPGAADAAPDPLSPSEPSSRPSSSRTASKGAAAGQGKPGSAGRPLGRSLRSAARSKSMPLPEFEWFGGEEGYEEEYVDTTESMADEDGLGEAGTSTATPAAVTPSGAAVHPFALLAGAAADAEPACDGHAHTRGSGSGDGDTCSSVDTVAAATDGARASSARRPSRLGMTGGAGGLASPNVAGLGQWHPSADATGVAGGSRAGSWGLSPFAAAVYDDRDSQDGTDAGGGAAGGGGLSAAGGLLRGELTECSAPELLLRPTPLNVSAFSPFADAADMPWSPHSVEDPTRLPARFSVDSPSTRHSKQQQQLLLQQAGTPAAAESAAGGVLRSPPRRVAFVSPFAQLAASEVYPFSGEEAEAGEGGLRGQLGPDSGARGCNGAQEAAPRPAAAASTANSTDVHVLIEKDQQSTLDGCWGVLGACSKPPSGGSYPSGPSGRPSPTSPGNASPLAARAVGAGADMGLAAGAVSPATPTKAGGVGVGARELAEAVSEAVAGLDALALALPGVMGFPPIGEAAGVVAEAGADSDQFDEDDEDATLHTTAWVRL